MPAHVIGAGKAAGRPALESLARDLAGAFPRFWISTARMRDHLALAAQRRDLAEPGLSAVITPDPDEMRKALSEDGDP